MTFGRRLLAAAACVPLLAALGACSEDEPEPKFAPSESPTPTETTTPEPAAWEEKSEDGAVAFAEHWVDVFNDAQLTGDTDGVHALSTKSCGTCGGFAEMLEDLYGNGGSLESDGWKVLQAVPAQRLPANEGRVSMRVLRSAQVIRYGDGQPDDSFPRSQVTLSARLIWKDMAWQMNDLVALE